MHRTDTATDFRILNKISDIEITFTFLIRLEMVVVISYRTIRAYTEKYNDVEDQLNNWYTVAEKSDWPNFNDILGIF